VSRIPRGIRISGVVAAVLGTVMAAGYVLGAATTPVPTMPWHPAALASPETKPAPKPDSKPDSSPATGEGLPGEGGPAAEETMPHALSAGSAPTPLALLNPVTGPNLPPLPEDANGPFGSRRSTGTYEVALTFDDGPDPQWTPQVLRLLRQYQIKATFCLLGVNVAEFPGLVRQIAEEGHTLCNHSWEHDLDLGKRGYDTILADMRRTNEAIRAAVPDVKVSYFRQPGGTWTEAAVSAAKSLGMTSLHWDVDPKDWLKPGARAISTMVNSSAIPGAIVLLHDGGGDRRGTVEALRSILPNLTARFPLVALPAGIDPPRRHGLQPPVHLGQ
jgi:peptidoglycan-N-acetylglucosamine deacetylase